MSGTNLRGIHICATVRGLFAVASCGKCAPSLNVMSTSNTNASNNSNMVAHNYSSNHCPVTHAVAFNLRMGFWLKVDGVYEV